MSQFLAALDGAWRVLLAGLLLGSLLPALFAVGIRQLALAGPARSASQPANARLHRAAAYALFFLVVSCVLLGLTYIVMHGFGYRIDFAGILPVVSKK